MQKKTIAIGPVKGQALLTFIGRNNINEKQFVNVYDANTVETVNCNETFDQTGEIQDGLVFDGDCLSVCAWLMENDITVDLVYIDPPICQRCRL